MAQSEGEEDVAVVGEVDDVVVAKVLLPESMTLDAEGRLKLGQELGVGSIILAEEGTPKEVKVKTEVWEKAVKEAGVRVS